MGLRMIFSKQAEITGPTRACRRPYPWRTAPARAPTANLCTLVNAAQYSQTQRLADQQSRQTDRLTNRQTNRQKDRKTAERQTDRQPTNRQTTD